MRSSCPAKTNCYNDRLATDAAVTTAHAWRAATGAIAAAEHAWTFVTAVLYFNEMASSLRVERAIAARIEVNLGLGRANGAENQSERDE